MGHLNDHPEKGEDKELAVGNNINRHKQEEAKDEEQKQEQECKTPECPNIPQSQIERADMRKPEGEQGGEKVVHELEGEQWDMSLSASRGTRPSTRSRTSHRCR